MFFFRNFQHILRFLIMIIKPFRTHHFRRRKGGTHLAGNDTIRQVTHPCHGGQQGKPVQLYISNPWIFHAYSFTVINCLQLYYIIILPNGKSPFLFSYKIFFILCLHRTKTADPY